MTTTDNNFDDFLALQLVEFGFQDIGANKNALDHTRVNGKASLKAAIDYLVQTGALPANTDKEKEAYRKAIKESTKRCLDAVHGKPPVTTAPIDDQIDKTTFFDSPRLERKQPQPPALGKSDLISNEDVIDFKAALTLVLDRLTGLERTNKQSGSASVPVPSLPSHPTPIKKGDKPSIVIESQELERAIMKDNKLVTAPSAHPSPLNIYHQFLPPVYKEDRADDDSHRKRKLMIGLEGPVEKTHKILGAGFMSKQVTRWLSLFNWTLKDYADFFHGKDEMPIHVIDLAHCYIRVSFKLEKDNYYKFELFTPISHHKFFHKDLRAIRLWYNRILESIISGRLILYSSLGISNGLARRQGYLLVTALPSQSASVAAHTNTTAAVPDFHSQTSTSSTISTLPATTTRPRSNSNSTTAPPAPPLDQDAAGGHSRKRSTSNSVAFHWASENTWLKWCFVYEGVFGIAKSDTEFSIIDLTMASITKSTEAPLTFFITAPIGSFSFAAQSQYEFNVWFLAVKTVLETAKIATFDPLFWHGDLIIVKSSYSFFSHKETKRWCVLKDGKLFTYPGIDTDHPDAIYDLVGASMRVQHHLPYTFQLLLPQRSITGQASVHPHQPNTPSSSSSSSSTAATTTTTNTTTATASSSSSPNSNSGVSVVTFKALGKNDFARVVGCLEAVIAKVNIPPRIVRKGNLFKAKKSGILDATRDSKFLYFVLTEKFLYQYETPKDHIHQREIDLCFATLHIPTDVSRSFAFTIESPLKIFRLIASTEQEAKEWIDDIGVCIKSARLAKMQRNAEAPYSRPPDVNSAPAMSIGSGRGIAKHGESDLRKTLVLKANAKTTEPHKSNKIFASDASLPSMVGVSLPPTPSTVPAQSLVNAETKHNNNDNNNNNNNNDNGTNNDNNNNNNANNNNSNMTNNNNKSNKTSSNVKGTGVPSRRHGKPSKAFFNEDLLPMPHELAYHINLEGGLIGEPEVNVAKLVLLQESDWPKEETSTMPVASAVVQASVSKMEKSVRTLCKEITSKTRKAELERTKLTRTYSLPQVIHPQGAKKQDNPTIVIDNGSGTIRAGLGGERFPRTIFPTIVGYEEGENYYVGFNCIRQMNQSFMHVVRPFGPFLSSAAISNEMNWDDVMNIYEHIYVHELMADPSEFPLMIVEPLGLSVADKKAFLSALFENFQPPTICMMGAAPLSMFGHGKKTGVAVTWGNRLQIVPVSDGFILGQGQLQAQWGGAHLTQALSEMLQTEKQEYLSVRNRFENARRMKETFCEVALDLDLELNGRSTSELRREYTCVGNTNDRIVLDSERFRIPEILFNPHLGGIESDGITQMIVNSVGKCAIDLRRRLMANVFLSGGTTSFAGFTERLDKELRGMNMNYQHGINSAKNRKYAPWIGASMFCSDVDYQESYENKMFYSLAYQESGDNDFTFDY